MGRGLPAGAEPQLINAQCKAGPELAPVYTAPILPDPCSWSPDPGNSSRTARPSGWIQACLDGPRHPLVPGPPPRATLRVPS